MLPMRTSGSVCLSSPDFYALMGTAVVITAAATFWCTRQFSKRVIKVTNSLDTNVRRAHSNTLTTSESTTASTNVTPKTIPSVSVAADELSYLCTGCGTEKYSPEQLESVVTVTKSPYKMVILVRTDLNMGKGKAAAQCCHAVLAAFKATSVRQPDALKRWEREGQPKVTLKIDTETEMIELMNKARLAGLTAESIRDAGRTQVAAGTRTVCAIGPAPAKLIDTITGHLKLY